MFSLQIINHGATKLSEKIIFERDDLSKVVERYFNMQGITLTDFLNNTLTVTAVDLDTDEQYDVQIFHILFEPTLIPQNATTTNKSEDRGEPRQVDA